MRKIHITRLATVAGVTGAMAVAAIALASGQKAAPQTAQTAIAVPAASHSNVKFVTAPPALMARYAATSTQSSEGVRAYVDADTKQLRSATQAELDLAAAKSVPAAARGSASFSDASVSEAPQSVQLANGATMVSLDDTYLSYAVASIGPDGKVRQACVEKQPSAKAALRAAVALKGADSHEK